MGTVLIFFCFAMVAGLVALFGSLIWIGFRNGDRADDATAQVRLVRMRHPEGATVVARIAVTNPGDRTIMVSASSRPVMRITAAMGTPQLRSTVLYSPPFVRAGVELLGALEPCSTREWTLPVAHPAASAMRVTVRLDRDRRRSRRITHTLCVTGWTEPTLTSPIGVATE
jgi:hypothetical protein